MGYYKYIGDPAAPKECRYNQSSTSNEACRSGHCPGKLPNKRNGIGCPLKSDGTPHPEFAHLFAGPCGDPITVVEDYEGVITNQPNPTDLTLLEFLDIIGAAIDSPEGWDNSEDTWMEYVDKTGVPTNHEYHFTDWVEVGPAMKGLAAMIRSGVFKSTTPG